MRIHMVVPGFPGDAISGRGGMATAAHGMAAALERAGVSATIVRLGGQTPHRRPGSGYDVVSVRARDLRHSLFRETEPVSAMLARMRDGLVLLNGVFDPTLWMFGVLLRRHGIPYLVVPHNPYDDNLFRKRAPLKAVAWRTAEKPLLDRAAAVQLLDPRQEALLRERGVTTLAFAVPNGYDARSAPARLPGFAEPGEPVRLLVFGRLAVFHKGIDLLLSAVARLIGTHDVRLTLQGPDWGDGRRIHRQVAALGIGDRVRVLEPDYRTPSWRIMADHDVLCLPSRFEGFGLSALEAMLAGRVVLVSESAGVAPYVQQSRCGRRVTPDVPSVTAGLADLIARRRCWPAMGRRGRACVERTLSWDRIARRALASYERVLDGRVRDCVR